MASRDNIPASIKATHSETSPTPSGSSLPNAFGRIIASRGVVQAAIQRDRYSRLVPKYNEYYNLYQPAKSGLPTSYTPYDYREPLFNNRSTIIANLPRNYTLAPPSKKPRKQWV